jgi:DNA-binding HxlR family transcriptional regulator
MSTPYHSLEPLFHEPKRLAILSELCGISGGLTFNELKRLCDLTDGNLSRHLTALQKEKVVRIEKTFVGVKPQTTVHLTESGRAKFLEYLSALERVLNSAAERARAETQKEKPTRKGISMKPARA